MLNDNYIRSVYAQTQKIKILSLIVKLLEYIDTLCHNIIRIWLVK